MGVIEHGLFQDLATECHIAYPDGRVEVLRRCGDVPPGAFAVRMGEPKVAGRWLPRPSIMNIVPGCPAGRTANITRPEPWDVDRACAAPPSWPRPVRTL